MYKKIKVSPKKNEPGAYNVVLTDLQGKKRRSKWFRGNRTFPSTSYNFKSYYGRICRLIEDAYQAQMPVEWRSQTSSSAIIHQKKSKAVGACD